MTKRSWLPAVVALPGLLAAAMALTSTAAAIVGRNPLWRTAELNLSEAAAVRDLATMVRLIRGGADPDARYRIRPDLLWAHESRLTPFEVALATGTPEVAEIWLRSRGPLEASVWIRAKCGARLDPGASIEPVVDQHRPADLDAGAFDAQRDCAGVLRTW